MITNYHEYEIENTPALVKVGKLMIKIDDNNNIVIEGHNNLDFNCDGDLNISAKKVNMVGSDDILIESKTHLVHIAPRIDLNPDKEAPSQEEMEEMVKSVLMQARAEQECCEEGHEH
jgi:hypothetical protein